MLVGASTHAQRDSLSIIITILQDFGQVCLIGVTLLLVSYSSTVFRTMRGLNIRKYVPAIMMIMV